MASVISSKKSVFERKQAGCRDFDECQPLTINAQRERQDEQPQADQQDWIRQAIGESRGRSMTICPIANVAGLRVSPLLRVKYQALRRSQSSCQH